MKVTKALRLIKQSHKAKAESDLKFRKEHGVWPDQSKRNEDTLEWYKKEYLKAEDQYILNGLK